MNQKEKIQYDSFLKNLKTEEAATLAYLRWKCETDLAFLAEYIFDMKDAYEQGRPRWDKKFHRWMCKNLQVEADTLLLVPRGHMKSSVMKLRVIQLILQKPNIRICLTSRTAKLVEDQLQDIAVMFQNQKLMELYPDIIPPPAKKYLGWKKKTSSELTLCRNPEWGRIPQENQIEAWGMDGALTGRHYDVIIGDDLVDYSNYTTAEQAAKALSFFSYLQSVLDPGGIIYMVGTRYHFDDIYGTIIREGWFKERVYVRTATEDQHGRSVELDDPGAIPIYSFFTVDSLKRIRERQGSFEFSCQYYNNPLPDDTKIFKRPYPTFAEMPRVPLEWYMAQDPATGTADGDDSAVLVFAIGAGRMWIRECFGMKVSYNRQAEIIVDKMVQYSPGRMGIEFGQQRAFELTLKTKMKECEIRTGKRLNIPLDDVVAPRDKSKVSKIRQTFGALLEAKRVVIHESCEDLITQMDYFPKGKHDDLVDVVAIGISMVDEFKGISEGLAVRNFGQKSWKQFFEENRTGRETGAWESAFR